MPPQLRYYDLKEIQYCYYNDLLDPLLEWDAKLITDYPQSIKDTLNNISNNLNDNDLFENISFYRTVIRDYVALGIKSDDLKSLRDNFDSAYVLNRLNYSKKHLDGKAQGYVLAWYMQIFSQKGANETFNLLYMNYDYNRTTPGINKFVDSLYRMVNHPDNIKPEELLGLTFEDSKHQIRKLSAIFDKDIFLIDCWATWCVPCREQMPALDSLSQEYKDRVQFISLSADQFRSSWDDWLFKADITKNHLIQLHAPDGFKNPFFKILMINAIPRYVLLSKSGKILNMAMPFPSAKQEFKKELAKYL